MKSLKTEIFQLALMGSFLLYNICSTIPNIGNKPLFNPIRDFMKENLKNEYLSNAYSTSFSYMDDRAFQPKRERLAFKRLKERFKEEFKNDKILKAINKYEGTVNYSEFREYLNDLGLDKDYFRLVKNS